MDVGPIQGLGLDFSALRQADPKARLHAAATELEAVWIGQVLKEARPQGGMFDKSFAAQTFHDMLDQALSRDMAQKGVFGLAHVLEQQVGAADEANVRHEGEANGSTR